MSVVTVVFNGAAHLAHAIQSVAGQTYDNVEYIVIDGGSTDSTVDVIRSYETQIDYWTSERDRGMYDALNKGISLARGDLIGTLNSDDWYEPDAVRAAVDAYLTNPGSILHGALRCFDKDRYLFTRPGPSSAGINLRAMEENHPTMFVPASVYASVGAFTEASGSVADWDFVLRCRKAGVPFVHLRRVIANFRIGGISSFTTPRRAHEKWRLRRKYGHPWSTLIFMLDLVKATLVCALRASRLYGPIQKVRMHLAATARRFRRPDR